MQTITLVLLGLFCIQLSRVYLVVPTDAFLCSYPGHSHESESELPPSSHDHHHDHDAETFELTALESQDDDRNYIQHCKDTLDGLGLTPAQPFITAAAIGPQLPEPTHQLPSMRTPAALETLLPPPFQPPRSISSALP